MLFYIQQKLCHLYIFPSFLAKKSHLAFANLLQNYTK